MSFWNRINQPKLKWQTLLRQFKRCYLQIPHAHSLNNTRCKLIQGSVNTYWVNRGKPSDFCHNVRFFAAPIKFRQKQEGKEDPSGKRVNGEITAEFIRLVTDDGHEIVPRRVALERARTLQLDLVEVQRNSKPPVCKIMDFHKEKYKQEIKEKDRAKNKSESTLRKGDCKEVRFSGKTEAKDLKMKADMVKRLIDRGYRVKCMATGNEDQDLGKVLTRLSSLVEDVAFVESGPILERKQAFVIVRHIKFGSSKKGPGKKASKAVGVTSSLELQEESDPAETEADSVLSDEVDTPISPSMRMADTWSVFDANDGIDNVFDFTGGAQFSNSTEKQTNAKLETASSPEDIGLSDFGIPILDSTRTNSVPSTLAGDPKNRFISPTPMDNRGVSAASPLRSAIQFPNQGKQTPSNLNSSPSTGETKQDRAYASAFRNSKLPLDEIPKYEQSRPGPPSSQQPSCRPFSAPKAKAPGNLDPSAHFSRPGPISQQPSFGAFSAPKAEAPEKLDPSANSSRPGPPSSQQPGFGAFSAPKAEAPGKIDPSANSSRPGPSSSQQPSYGTFSSPNAESPRKLDPSASSSRPGPPSSQQPSYGAFGAPKAEAPGKLNQSADFSHPGPPSSQQPSYGAFSAAKAEAPGKLNQSANFSHYGPPSSQQPSYGAFSTPKAEAPGKLNQSADFSHPGPPSSQQPSYGAFTAAKAEAPGKLNQSAKFSHPDPPSSQQPSYGAFSTPKAEAPGKLNQSANFSHPGPPSSQQPSYGAFSAPNAEAPEKLNQSANSARSEPRLPMPPRDGGPKTEQSHPVPPSSPTSSYGIFSSLKATPPGNKP